MTEPAPAARADLPRWVVPGIVVALAVLALVAWRVAAGLRDGMLASDFALLELATGEAARGAQLLGPYSRFGWRHPGPAYFYFLAPFHLAAGGNSAALFVGALVLNVGALATLVWVLARHAAHAGLLLLALPLALLHGAYLGPGFLYNIWNPAVTVLPLGLLLALGALLASGRAGPLPALAALASFLVQTHIGFVPVVVAVVLVAGVSSRLAGGGAGGARTLWLAAAVLVAFWALPLVEQFTHTPGNLTRIARFFGRAGDHPTLGQALQITARELAWLPSYAFFGARDQYAPYPLLGGARLVLVAVVALAQVGVLAWRARREASPYLRALARVSLVASGAAALAVWRVSGEVRPYLTTWISLVGTLGALAACAPWLRPSLPPARAAAILAAGLVVALALVGRPVVRDSQVPGAAALAARVVADLRQRGSQRPQIVIQTGSPELFYVASAVLLQVHKAGVAFAVNRPWWTFYGDRWRATGAEDDTLHFRAGALSGHAPLVCAGPAATDLCITRAP